MTAEQKEQLLHAQKEFAGLKPDEQRRLKDLHQKLEDAPDGDQLRRVMAGYCNWLKSLPPYQRAELLELQEPEKWIKRIKELREEQQQRESWAKDVAGLLGWMDEYATRNEARLLATLPESRQQEIAKLSPPMRQRLLKWMIWQGWQMARPGRLPPLSDDDLEDLRLKLSAETRKQLEGKPAAEQWRTVMGLVHRAVRHDLATRGIKGPLPPDYERQLDDFFQQLPKKEQDRLLSLPGDEIRLELRRMYLTQLGSAEPRIHGPGPPPRGPRPGGPGSERPRPPRPGEDWRPGRRPPDRRPPPTDPGAR